MFSPSIYRHRDKYCQPIDYGQRSFELDEELVKSFWVYARERMSVWRKKEAGEIQPRTEDLILQKYKFCNVYRELDKQTQIIHTSLAHLRDNFQEWLTNLLIFRFIARIETWQIIGLYRSGLETESALRSIQGTKFGDAYLFPPQVVPLLGYEDRIDFIANYLPKAAEKLSQIILTFKNISVFEGVQKMVEVLGVGLRFHMTEVLIDVAYQYPELVDLNGLFPIGPGSKPTMRRMNKSIKPESVCLELLKTQPADFPYLEIDGKRMPITAEGIEGLGCEFRKYHNLKTGNGKRRLYH